MLNVAIVIWVAAMILALVAGLLTLLYRRPGVPVLDLSGGTLQVLRNPKRYIRDPYGRIVQVLTVAAFSMGMAAIAIAFGEMH